MPAYQVDLTTSCYDDFEALPRAVRLGVAEVFVALANEPRPLRSATLAGRPHTRRVAFGDYRILYNLYEMTKRVVVVAILGGEVDP